MLSPSRSSPILPLLSRQCSSFSCNIWTNHALLAVPRWILLLPRHPGVKEEEASIRPYSFIVQPVI